MRVIMLDASGSGGICHYTYCLCNALSKLPIELVLLTTRQYELERHAPTFTVRALLPSHAAHRTHWAKGVTYLRTLRQVRRFVEAMPPDIFHQHQIKLPVLEYRMVRAFQRRGIRHLLTVHDVQPPDVRFQNPYLGRIYRRADGLIFHAEENRRRCLDRFGHGAHPNTRIIPHGDYGFLCTPMDRADARAQLGIANGGPVLLFFGYIRRYKGLDVLLDALPRIRASFPEATLVIAGKAVDDWRRYQAQIDRLGVRDAVRQYLDYVPLKEIAAFFAACDVVVLPYRELTQSGVVQLAHAYGRAVVATTVGGLPEVVRNGDSGRLVPPDDPASLAQAVVDVLGEPGRADRMGARGRDAARRNFRWDDIAAQVHELYRATVPTAVT